MTDNEKMARFQGPMFGEPPHEYYEQPDYLNDDAAAMSLLDTLVEKGYAPELYYNSGLAHWKLNVDGEPNLIGYWKPTRRAAVVAAVLQLIPDKP